MLPLGAGGGGGVAVGGTGVAVGGTGVAVGGTGVAVGAGGGGGGTGGGGGGGTAAVGSGGAGGSGTGGRPVAALSSVDSLIQPRPLYVDHDSDQQTSFTLRWRKARGPSAGDCEPRLDPGFRPLPLPLASARSLPPSGSDTRSRHPYSKLGRGQAIRSAFRLRSRWSRLSRRLCSPLRRSHSSRLLSPRTMSARPRSPASCRRLP